MTEIQFQNRIDEKVCIALGFFDSVHVGHRQIISRMKEYAFKNNCKSSIFTFDNNAYRIFNADEKQVYTYDERKIIFEELGIDYVVHAKFDKYFKSVSAEAFLSTLFETLNIGGIFCGYDYLFGQGGKGDADMLIKACSMRGVHIEVIGEIMLDGERISTTAVKQFLSHGDLNRVNRFLGQPYFISGNVVKGRNVGHLFNMPTANIGFSHDKLLPKCGVYGTYAYVNGQKYRAVTNIGSKPTFGVPSLSVETFIDNFKDNIYDTNLCVEFIKSIRDIQKFETPLALSNQIRLDLNWRDDA